MPESGTIRVVQLTDTHFFQDEGGRLLGVDTARTFAEVFAVARESFGTPDMYLLTGDLSQDETVGSYKRLSRALAEADAPVYSLPGNHDRRGALEQGFYDGPADVRKDRLVTRGNWLLVLLDSLVEGQVGGRLSASELEFLDTTLAGHPEHHALVCLHHQPVPIGAAWIDRIGLANGEEFLEIIDRHDNVRCVLWGHVHQEFDTRRNDVRYMATPSTCVQFKPRSASFGVDSIPPGFRWLELQPDGMMDSGVIRTTSVAPGLQVSSTGY